MRYSEEKKRMWVEGWRQSGKSVWAYAKEHGLSRQSFYNWTKAKKEPCFVELPSLPSQEAKPIAPNSEIRIEKGDLKIHIPLAMGRDELLAIIQGLGAIT
jgi:transposase-like protein